MDLRIDFIANLQASELDIFVRDVKRLEAESIEGLRLRKVSIHRQASGIVYHIEDLFKDGRKSSCYYQYSNVPPFNDWYYRERISVNGNENGI